MNKSNASNSSHDSNTLPRLTTLRRASERRRDAPPTRPQTATDRHHAQAGARMHAGDHHRRHQVPADRPVPPSAPGAAPGATPASASGAAPGATPASAPASAPARVAILAYGLLAYAAFLAAFTYAIGFVAGLGVPKAINDGVPGPLGTSLLINAALLGLFVVQHTVMARPAFKRWVTRFIPVAIERSTFVVAAAACLGLLYWQWRPLPTVLWDAGHPALHWGLRGLSALGWITVLAASFMVSHADLFGLRQALAGFRRRLPEPIAFRVVGLYRIVRHPLMLGFLIAFWATPTMTVGHLFFAAMITGYVFLGTAIEERDLVAHFGERYRAYRRAVPGVLPVRLGPRR